jgi:hypothetical protein
MNLAAQFTNNLKKLSTNKNSIYFQFFYDVMFFNKK